MRPARLKLALEKLLAASRVEDVFRLAGRFAYELEAAGRLDDLTARADTFRRLAAPGSAFEQARAAAPAAVRPAGHDSAVTPPARPPQSAAPPNSCAPWPRGLPCRARRPKPPRRRRVVPGRRSRTGRTTPRSRSPTNSNSAPLPET